MDESRVNLINYSPIVDDLTFILCVVSRRANVRSIPFLELTHLCATTRVELTRAAVDDICEMERSDFPRFRGYIAIPSQKSSTNSSARVSVFGGAVECRDAV
jgi:hypothetical protein